MADKDTMESGAPQATGSNAQNTANTYQDPLAAMAAQGQPAAKSILEKHVWTSEDTYASLAQKYYGSFQEPYWRLIYEHNQAIIGSHPNAIRVGLEIEIPALPDDLKK
jgi:nucleoid-associated protein YgaU